MNKDKDWEKEFDKKFVDCGGYWSYGSCHVCGGGKAQPIKEWIQKQLTEAKEEGKREAVKGVLSLTKYDYRPVGGISNQKFIFVDDIEKYLKSLKNKKL